MFLDGRYPPRNLLLISRRRILRSLCDFTLMLGTPFERMTYSSSIRSHLVPKRRANEAADPEFVLDVPFNQVITITWRKPASSKESLAIALYSIFLTAGVIAKILFSMVMEMVDK